MTVQDRTRLIGQLGLFVIGTQPAPTFSGWPDKRGLALDQCSCTGTPIGRLQDQGMPAWHSLSDPDEGIDAGVARGVGVARTRAHPNEFRFLPRFRA